MVSEGSKRPNSPRRWRPLRRSRPASARGRSAPKPTPVDHGNSEQRKKTPKFLLACLSLVGIVLTMLPLPDQVPQIAAIGVFFLAIGMAVMVAVGAMEDLLASKGYYEFEGLKFGFGLLVAVMVYLARRAALDDVDAVFHIDPGPLPMTVWAGTALNLIVPLLYAFAFASIVSVWVLFRDPDRTGKKRPPLRSRMVRWRLMEEKIVACAVFLASLIGAIYLHFQLGESNRREILYIVARTSDFNSDFGCDGIDTSGTVGLFIGPDQRKVLLAPEYVGGNTASKLLAVPKQRIPDRYPVFDCAPLNVPLDEWRKKYGVETKPEPKAPAAKRKPEAPTRLEPL